jgi:teichuronic acid biosynthesis glycosyltransferase TuaG
MPLHSIIVPSYNSINTVDSTIHSILSQTCKDYEILIIDDCSGIDMSAVYSKLSGNPRISILFQTSNQGPGSARNRGIDASSGRFLHFLDTDDIWLPSHLSATEAVHNITGCGLSSASYFRVGSYKSGTNWVSISKAPEKVTSQTLVNSNTLPLLTTTIDRSRVHVLPRFECEQALPSCKRISRPEDYLFWLDLLKYNPSLSYQGIRKASAVYTVSRKSRSSDKFRTLVRHYEINREKLGFSKLYSAFLCLNYIMRSLTNRSVPEILSIIGID